MSIHDTLQDNEQILFKHLALNQTSQENGDLIVTNLKLLFHPHNQKSLNHFQRSWATIEKIKYSPANDPKDRVMIKVDLVMSGPSYVFHLVDSDLMKKKNELENLKTIISQVRKNYESAGSKHTTKDVLFLTSSSNNQNEKNENISLKQNSKQRIQNVIMEEERKIQNENNLNDEMKRYLLQTDDQLAKSYRDLVQDNNILDENQFWSTHFTNNKKMNYESNKIQNKAKLTTLFSDIKQNYHNGKLSFHLTVENKEHIFLMYPSVKKAFETEVPLRLSEQDFWIAYFQSEFYGRDKGYNHDNQMNLTDDMFTRYQIAYENSLHDSSNNKTSHNELQVVSNNSQTKKRKLTDVLEHSDVDLTATYNDYHTKENMNMEDISQASLPSAVAKKYMKHSDIYMSHTNQSYNPDHKQYYYDELEELKSDSNHDYIELDLKSSRNNMTSVSLSNEDDQNSSAFGRSKAFSSQKSFSRSNNFSELNPDTIKKTMSSVVHSSEFMVQLFKDCEEQKDAALFQASSLSDPHSNIQQVKMTTHFIVYNFHNIKNLPAMIIVMDILI
jgi:hypothetical protein